MYGDDIRNGTAAGIVFSKHSAASAAISYGNDQLRIRYGIESTLQSFFHVHRYWTCYKKEICVPWARNEFYAGAFKVVVGIIESLNLKFAAIAGTGINMANAESAANDFPQFFLQIINRMRRANWGRNGLSQDSRAYHAR